MNVAIVKYNAGNIGSVENAVRRMGIEPIVTDNVEKIQSADRVIFPGQGDCGVEAACAGHLHRHAAVVPPQRGAGHGVSGGVRRGGEAVSAAAA